jgi:hypothetical protein
MHIAFQCIMTKSVLSTLQSYAHMLFNIHFSAATMMKTII